MINDDTTERKVMCQLNAKHWKGQQNWEQHDDSSEDNATQGLEIYRNNMSVQGLEALFSFGTTGTESEAANKAGMGQLCFGASGCLFCDCCNLSSSEGS